MVTAQEQFINVIYEGQTNDRIRLRFRRALMDIERFYDPNPDPEKKIYSPRAFTGADNVFSHVFSCAGLALAQVTPPPGSGFYLETLVHTLNSHDDNELISGDQPVLLAQQDISVVSDKQLEDLLGEDYQNFLEFEKARNWLSAPTEQRAALEPPQAESIVANIIDLVQGNSTFFMIYSHDRALNPGEEMTPQLEEQLARGQAYFLNRQQVYLEALEQLPAGPQYEYARQISQQFLAQQEEFIPLLLNEIRTNSDALCWLEFGIFSLLASFCVHLAVKKIAVSESPESMLTEILESYLAKTGTGEIQANILQSIRLNLQRAFTEGLTQEQISQEVRLGLLQFQREGMYKPAELQELADTQKRRLFAENLIDQMLNLN